MKGRGKGLFIEPHFSSMASHFLNFLNEKMGVLKKTSANKSLFWTNDGCGEGRENKYKFKKARDFFTKIK